MIKKQYRQRQNYQQNKTGDQRLALTKNWFNTLLLTGQKAILGKSVLPSGLPDTLFEVLNDHLMMANISETANKQLSLFFRRDERKALPRQYPPYTGKSACI